MKYENIDELTALMEAKLDIFEILEVLDLDIPSLLDRLQEDIQDKYEECWNAVK